jgi:ABC-type transport system involved in multi-copper enzyme maturation permease subunit
MRLRIIVVTSLFWVLAAQGQVFSQWGMPRATWGHLCAVGWALSLFVGLVVLGKAPSLPAVSTAGGIRTYLRRLLALPGPLFWYDLARLARRPRTAQLRFFYGLLLLCWLTFVVHQEFPRYLNPSSGFDPVRLAHYESPRLAQIFVAAIIAVQGAAVFALTPAYVSMAISEEKERQTLEMLFTTALSDRDIVLGKLFGRLAHLFNILLVAVPILCLSMLWGGVDACEIVGGIAATILALLSVGGISILCSVVASDSFKAVGCSYLIVFIFGVVCLAIPTCSPMTFVGEFQRAYATSLEEWRTGGKVLAPGILQRSLPTQAPQAGVNAAGIRAPSPPEPWPLLLGMLAGCAALHLVIFLLCTTLAVGALREPSSPPVKPVQRPRVVFLDELSWGPFDTLRDPRPSPLWGYRPPLPPVSDDPLLWKELSLGSLWEWERQIALDGVMQRWRWILPTVLLSAGPFFYWYWCQPGYGGALRMAFLPVIRVLTVVLAGIGCVGLALRAAATVSRERDQRTLLGLFLLPVERADILRAKRLGCLLRWRVCAQGLALVWLAGLVSGVLHAWSVLLLAATCAAFALFLVSVGLWLSVVARQTRWALLSMTLILFLLFGGGGLGTGFRDLDSSETGLRGWSQSTYRVGSNPVRAWWSSCFSWQEGAQGLFDNDPEFRLKLSGIATGAVLFATAGYLFWRLACRRIAREPIQPPGRGG